MNNVGVHHIVAGTLLVVSAACAGDATTSATDPAAAIRDSLRREPAGFVAETTLVAFVDHAARTWAGDIETRAELELLRLRAIDRVARLPEVDGFNPYHALIGVPDPPPGLRTWTEANAADIVFSEPSASWFVPSNVLWDLHDRYTGTRVADEIAWDAANAGFAGECEGVAGCYLDVLIEMTGRYLEAHPNGMHRADALESVRSTLAHIADSDPATPLCGDDLTSQAVRPAQVVRVRRAIEAAAVGDTVAARPALIELNRIERRCAG
jgi:hypothetical protein